MSVHEGKVAELEAALTEMKRVNAEREAAAGEREAALVGHAAAKGSGRPAGDLFGDDGLSRLGLNEDAQQPQPLGGEQILIDLG